MSCVDSIRSLIRSSVLYKSLCENELHLDQHIPKSAALIVGIKDLGLDLDLGPLEEAENEARIIASKCEKIRSTNGVVQLVLGFTATKDFVKQRLAEADLVHFATHALITPSYEEGGILFVKPLEFAKSNEECMQSSLYPASLEKSATSSSSEAQNGRRDLHERTLRGYELQKKLADEVLLDADEISGMKLTARLVVLSACETGRGVIAGDGVAGLGRALTRAGVPSTILSMWNVGDRATKKLMLAFYTNLISKGMPAAVALQDAMIKMIQQTESEANLWEVKHWAAFQVFGLPIVCLK